MNEWEEHMEERLIQFVQGVRDGYTIIDFRRVYGMRHLEYTFLRNKALDMGLVKWRNPVNHMAGLVVSDSKVGHDE